MRESAVLERELSMAPVFRTRREAHVTEALTRNVVGPFFDSRHCRVRHSKKRAMAHGSRHNLCRVEFWWTAFSQTRRKTIRS